MKSVLSSTPWQKYVVRGHTVHVKREDLCIDGPAFSKMRGVERHIQHRPEYVIGVLDTYHSKAGWGTAIMCKILKRKCVVFYPAYKKEPQPRPYQIFAHREGAELIGLDAGRSFILYHQAKKLLRDKYGDDVYMMPNALKCPESVEETAKELVETVPKYLVDNTIWIVSISSGTIAAGVHRGLNQLFGSAELYIHEGYSRPAKAAADFVIKRGDCCGGNIPVVVVDEGYEYKNYVRWPCPFPCNPFYDLKAWRWLECNIDKLAKKYQSIVFWNIGK